MLKLNKNKIQKIIAKNPLCKPMNDLKDVKDSSGNTIYWLNPNDQTCFNYGWFTEQDFLDWTNGVGKIIKGNTVKEKQKFWDLAQFKNKYCYGWAIGYYKKYYYMIDENYQTEYDRRNGNKNPLKINSRNHAEIISKCFGSVTRWYSDIYLEYNSHHNSQIEAELQGIKATLFDFGIGYFGACSTPDEPENLNWISDIAKYKSQYLYLQKQNVIMPDFDFVYNYND